VVTTGLVLTIAGAIIGIVAWLGARGRLPRNCIAGMRTPATLASDEAWKAAHRASAWALAVAAVVSVSCGLWLLIARPSEDSARVTTTIAFGAVLIVAVVGGVQAHVVAKDVERRRRAT
jgi:uncharacterized membrane protein